MHKLKNLSQNAKKNELDSKKYRYLRQWVSKIHIKDFFKITNKNFNLLGSIFEYKKVVIFCKMGLYRSKTIEIGLSYFPISQISVYHYITLTILSLNIIKGVVKLY